MSYQPDLFGPFWLQKSPYDAIAAITADIAGGERNVETLTRRHGGQLADSAKSIVRYFLSNASSWRGPVAHTIKAELKGML